MAPVRNALGITVAIEVGGIRSDDRLRGQLGASSSGMQAVSGRNQRSVANINFPQK
jgi:hypothetical protein